MKTENQPPAAPAATPAVPAFFDHRRRFDTFRYVYPVISRRAGGLSIGVNLNPDKICNFDCVYCQVDRRVAPQVTEVDRDVLAAELVEMLDALASGRLWQQPRFASTPQSHRRLEDFALSGDGEPTTSPHFEAVVAELVRLKAARGLDEVKIVLITDAACLHHARVRRGLALMDGARGEVWAKLDAGTEAFYAKVARTRVPFRRVLRNLALTAAERPLTLQSLFFAWEGQPPPDAEIDAWIERVVAIEAAGTLREVQVYTVARRPAEPACTALSLEALEGIAARLRQHTRAPVRVHGGAAPAVPGVTPT
ncbi:MAG: radical SAM protein [Deltaproteobacteria bacterium]|nr:radical SAM protein [Deltaproteobacteria bacterium]MCB9785768.1 radical SAM protein [Deltaproteobacteria bacterium]